MEPLFDGEPMPLPAVSGPTWSVTFPPAPKPAPVQHAEGYEPFVVLAESFGTDPRALFDLWAFAHFIRAHREALEGDPDLLHGAVVFLGNVLIARYPECFWSAHPGMLFVETERGPMTEIGPGRWREDGERRALGVGGTVPAILEADEARFRDFQSVVDRWPLKDAGI